MSVYNNLLEGRYDDQLHRPFLGIVTYELLNQLADDKHHSIAVDLLNEESVSGARSGRASL